MKISIAGEPQKLKKKLFHVTKEQVNEIETSIVSGWSSDLPINLAQHYLQSQFPELNGLQSTLLQSKKQLSQAIGIKLY